MAVVGAVLVIVAAYAGWRWAGPGNALNQETLKANKGATSSGQAPAPVRTTVAGKKDFPVFLNGLGVVQATNTVTVRSRVDGQIEKVGFEEGQMVREGDLLVQIDAAPFQAGLDQAIAKLAQDEASLTTPSRTCSARRRWPSKAMPRSNCSISEPPPSRS